MVSLEIPGIMLCAAFSSLGILYSRYFSIYSIRIQSEWIDIIWRAICISPIVLYAIVPTVPLQVISRSPLCEIDVGVLVHRLTKTAPFARLLAPVIYGIPFGIVKYLSGTRSWPDCSIITEPRRHHAHDFGISKGISSLISVALPPTFS